MTIRLHDLSMKSNLRSSCSFSFLCVLPGTSRKEDGSQTVMFQTPPKFQKLGKNEQGLLFYFMFLHAFNSV